MAPHPRPRATALLLWMSVLAYATSLPSPQAEAEAPTQSRPAPANHSRVIIVGAGPSGIAVAGALLAHNLTDILVLEAENRIGGRINTIDFEGQTLEMGAEWVHGEEHNIVFEMANGLGLLDKDDPSKDYNFNTTWVWSGGAVPDRQVTTYLHDTAQDLYKNGEEDMDSYNGSTGAWFRDRLTKRLEKEGKMPAEKDLEGFLGWLRKAVAFSDGDDMSNVSPRSDWEASAGNIVIRWKNGGYRSVLNLLMGRFEGARRELPVEDHVHLNSEVAAIHYGDRLQGGDQTPPPPVVVELADGSRFTADMVVVTVSLGVLKASAATMFDPPLPEKKMNAIRNLGFGQVNKMFLRFAEPWWPKGQTGFNFLVTPEDLAAFKQKHPELSAKGDWVDGISGFYVDQHAPNKVLMDWIVGEPARNMELYSDEEVKQGLMAILDMYLGQNYTIPEPVGFVRSKWCSNPHFRGSYSFRSMASESSDAWHRDLMNPEVDNKGKPVLMLAGEATNPPHHSTVHGAIESGFRESDRILTAVLGSVGPRRS